MAPPFIALFSSLEIMEISLICAFMDNCIAFSVEYYIVTEFAVCFVYFKVIHNGNILYISFENLLFQSMIASGFIY